MPDRTPTRRKATKDELFPDLEIVEANFARDLEHGLGSVVLLEHDKRRTKWCLDRVQVRLVEAAIAEQGSLRKLASKTKLSPTYLSLIRNGKQTISPRAFRVLYYLLERNRGVTRI
jgi:hypothetical protein